MDSFDINEYSEKSREVLIKVLEEIQEQFLTNGESSQFWFDLNRVTDKSLTEPIIEGWLQVLSNEGALHYYKPTYSEGEEAVVFETRRLMESYKWSPQMATSYILNRSPDPHFRPSFALDIRDTDLPLLIEIVSGKIRWKNFRQDGPFEDYFYDDVRLEKINSSPALKAILRKLLTTKWHTITPEEILRISFEEEVRKGKATEDEEENYIKDPSNKTKPAKLISRLKTHLRSASHDIDIESDYKGTSSLVCYRLTVKQ